MPDFDIVIRNGTVVDGTGSEAYHADIGITDGRIADIGHISARASEEIDAEGHVVSPGFIDAHGHMDAQVMWDELGTCSCWHGVTTVVMGNCGFTLAPVRSAERALVVRNLERAEDISPIALAQGIDWSWETFGEYLDTVERRPKAINYAAYVGHSALRTWAMGERAFDGRASDDDLLNMEIELRSALDAGAIGLSTSRSEAHETSDDRPVASRLAEWTEVQHLVEIMGQQGKGIFEIALEPGARSEDPNEREEFNARMRKLAVATQVPFTFSVNRTRSDDLDWKSELKLIGETVAQGGRMFGQSHSRGVSNVSSFKTRLPFDSLPHWAELRSHPLEAQRTMLRDPDIVDVLVDEAMHGTYKRTVGAEAPPPIFDRLLVLDSPLPPYQSVSAVASARNVDPVRAMIQLGLESDFTQLFVQLVADPNDEALLTIMRDPNTVMTFSDTGAHVSQILDCSIHTHLLAYWVRAKEEFTMEEAIHMITDRPAQAWGLASRGRLEKGWAADINVFDPATVGPAMPEVAFDLPGGVPRLKQRSSGFLATIVGGQTTFSNGEASGARSGRLLRRFNRGGFRGAA